MNKLVNFMLYIYQTALDKHEKNVIKDVLQKEDFSKIENKPIKKVKQIIFVVPELERFAGGHTSILRLGTKLSEKYKVIYANIGKQNSKEMREIANSNLGDVNGEFGDYIKVKEYEDANNIIIATSWQTAYYAKQLLGYKMYFVQDYEPYFFKLNERYLLARKTYEMGFHIVSLGQWNIQQIKRECNTNSILDFIDFPYESKEYANIIRNYMEYKHKKTIKLVVYAKEDGKRLPNLIQHILVKAKEKLEIKGILLDIYFFGFDKKYKVDIGQNLGKLNKKELADLYKICDFGMVASMTNISLVPYEMLAMGLPIIEFLDGSFSSFFPEGSATLINLNVDDFVLKIEKCLRKPEFIEKQIEIAQNYLKQLSWSNSAKQFIKIIEEKVLCQ